MKYFFKKYWLRIVGILVGSLGGNLYYYYVGCVSGTCPITSRPHTMIIYGGLIGYFIFELFSGGNKPKKVEGLSDKSIKKSN